MAIPDMNKVAIYLANQGMEYMKSFAELPGMFGKLQDLLNDDMGLGAPNQDVQVLPNFWYGEICDASPPISPEFILESPQYTFEKKDTMMVQSPLNVNQTVNVNIMVNVNVDINAIMTTQDMGDDTYSSELGTNLEEFIRKLKAKDKVLTGYDFNDDGLLSAKAIDLLDSGALSYISTAFEQEIVDLEEQVFPGINAKDVLNSAVCGTLEDFLSHGTSQIPRATNIKLMEVDATGKPDAIMDVAEVLLVMAEYEKKVINSFDKGI